MDLASPSKRLKYFREEVLKVSQRAMATELGVSAGLVGSLETDAREVSDKVLNRLRDHLGISPDWLLHGKGDMLTSGQVGFDTRAGYARPPRMGRPYSGDIEVGGQDYSFVKRLDVSASAGHGQVAESEDVIGQMAFSRGWLIQRGLSAGLCGLVKAKGDSMEPLIPDGSLMLADFGINFALPAGIYILRLNDEVLVKHIDVTERDAVGNPLGLVLRSENPQYDRIRLQDEGLRDFRPIGRVITVIRDLL